MPNTKSIGIAYEDQQLDGAIIGKVGGTAGFYGVTPIAQPSLPLTTTAIGALTTSSVCAMSTAQLQALQTTVNNLVIDFKALGLSA